MTLILSGSDGLSDVDGTAATPAIRGTDTNTGIFFPAADTIAFSEGGTEAARFDSSGNLGIGTASPTRKLQISASGSACAIRIDNTASGRPMLLTYDDSQNLTLINSSDTGYFAYNNGTGAGTERMRIDSSGNLLVGTTNTNPIVTGAVGNVFMSGSGFRIAQTSGASYIGINSASGTALQFYTYSGGLSTAGAITSSGTTTSYGTSSDYRLKENITPLTNALNKVTQLKPVSFTWTGDKRNDTGFIAHELQEVMPNAVYGEKDAVDNEGNPIYQNVDTSFLVATLTAAIQELKATVDAQAARIAALEGAAV
jgi:hypothetical protein